MINLFKKREELIYLFILFVSSVIFVLPLFSHAGRPATFDAPFHITNIAQFSVALKNGDFPVYWENGFANYGLPIGIVAHQVPSYLGAFFNILLNNPTLSFNLLTFLGIALSSLCYYRFLRIYFPPLPSFLGAFLFNFAPYRILNVYIRGAEPEVFSNIFLPLILIAIYKVINEKKYIWLFAFTIFVALLALTHPMNLLIYSFFFGPYFVYCLWQAKQSLREKAKEFSVFLFGGLLSLGIAAYYLIPLSVEIRYFYIGLSKNQLAPNHFLGFLNFFTERWAYETAVDKITRGQILQTGIIETALFLVGITFLIYQIYKKKKLDLVGFAVLTGFLVLFFTLSVSNPIYQTFAFLGNIQYPWRMLNTFIFIPPIIAAFIFTKKPNIIFALLFMAAIVFLRFPQLYGKNFTVYPDSIYYFNQKNVHSDLMSTLWMDYSQNYSVKTKQYDVIGGQGRVTSSKIKNSSRTYIIDAKTSVQMVDYTFYFPGWKAYIDGRQTTIQFQDANYRGLIEYNVPPGRHSVMLKFGDTLVRFLAKLISIVSIFSFLILLIFRTRLLAYLKKL